VLVMSLLSKNMLDPTFFKFDAIRDVIKKVLPHQATGIDAHGITYCYMCASELLDALLQAVRNDLEAKHLDAADVARAKTIMDAVHKASTRNHKSPRRRPLTRRWWTFDLVQTNGSAFSL